MAFARDEMSSASSLQSGWKAYGFQHFPTRTTASFSTKYLLQIAGEEQEIWTNQFDLKCLPSEHRQKC